MNRFWIFFPLIFMTITAFGNYTPYDLALDQNDSSEGNGGSGGFSGLLVMGVIGGVIFLGIWIKERIVSLQNARSRRNHSDETPSIHAVDERRTKHEICITDIVAKHKAEMSALRQDHNHYVASIVREHKEDLADLKNQNRQLSSSLESMSVKLAKERAKAERLQKTIQRGIFSLDAIRKLFRNGVAKPVVAIACISSNLIRQTGALFAGLVQKHLQEKWDRILVLSMFGFMGIIVLLFLALITPSKALIAIACTFAIVASSIYIKASSSKSKEEDTVKPAQDIRPPLDGSLGPRL